VLKSYIKHWIGDTRKQNKTHVNKQKYNEFRARSENGKYLKGFRILDTSVP